MAHTNWEADKILDVYIYDYLVKKKLDATAKSFITKGKFPQILHNKTRRESRSAINSNGLHVQSNASALVAKMYEDRMKRSNAMELETFQPLLDASMAILKSTANHPR
ncbi:hypothetical protein ACFE04_003700 [Oxalis oulophora]